MKSGNNNSGDMNSGHENSGNMNSGDRNSGIRNSGNMNSGYYNSGSYNSGDYNSGSSNNGDWNSGYYNSGSINSGSWNSGNKNSGDWNSGDGNSGIFNSTTPTLTMFNKPTNWTYDEWYDSVAYDIMCHCPYETTSFVETDKMSDKEKKEHPEHEITGGYLKIAATTQEAKQKWWDELSKSDRREIYCLPNFDADVFESCTEIKVDRKELEELDTWVPVSKNSPTNGSIFLKTYPNAHFCNIAYDDGICYVYVDLGGSRVRFTSDWWNATYKVGDSNENS